MLNLADANNLPKDKKLFNEKRFKAVLESHGNSIVYSKNDSLVKIHIHTLKPGDILTYAQQFGEFKTIKVDNMSEQHEELLLDDKNEREQAGLSSNEGMIDVKTSAAPTVIKKPKVKKDIGIVAVSVGKGINELFSSLLVDYIVSGGQSMNPSTGDIVNALKAIDCKNVIILPNNGNIVMAANQAAEIMKDVYNVKVIPTKTITEGLTACMVFNPEGSFEENIESMVDAYKASKSAEVTYAVRDTKLDGVEIKKGQFIAISGKRILACDNDKIKVLFKLINQMVDSDSELISIYCGEDVSNKEREKLEKELSKKFSDDYDIQVLDGGQPVYSFFVSVE